MADTDTGGKQLPQRVALTAPPDKWDGRDEEWLSKTDLVTYIRCPFAFSQLYRGTITRDDLFDDPARELLAAGIEFHSEVDASAPPVQAPSMEVVQNLLAAGTTILNPPLLDNAELKIYGRPDGIVPDKGNMLPVEYKSHRRVSRLDRLELAFYWLVLNPWRSNPEAKPRGVLVLRGDAEPQEQVIDLRTQDFRDVFRYMDQARMARKEDVPAKVFGCTACRGVLAAEVQRQVVQLGHITRVYDLGPVKAEVLSQIGINNLDDLADSNPLSVWLALQKAGLRVYSVDAINGWIQHALSYRQAAPRFYGSSDFPLGGSYVVLDCEYLTDPEDFVWLAGLSIVTDSGEAIDQRWTDWRPASERDLLRWLAGALDRLDPAIPLVTWNGLSADLPAVRKAAARHGLPDPLLGRQHIDLMQWAIRNVRLPIERFGLKELADHFGFGTHEFGMSGFMASVMYQATQRQGSKTLDDQLRGELLDYNQDDLAATVMLVEQLRDLCQPDKRQGAWLMESVDGTDDFWDCEETSEGDWS